MKIFVLSLFVAAAFAAPAPLDEETGEPVELIVNGIADGEPLEIGDVLGIKVKEHVEGTIVSSTNLLYPLTAAGLEEAAAADVPEPVDVVEEPEHIDIAEEPEHIENFPQPIELPPPAAPEVAPFPPLLPIPDSNIPSHPAPEVVPLPPIHIPGIVPDFIEDQVPIEDIHAPQFPTGEVYNDGVVQVTVNAPEPGVLTTVQTWFNMVLNYFNGDVQTTHQIV